MSGLDDLPKLKHPAVYDKCMKLAERDAAAAYKVKKKPIAGLAATPWIHLADAVESGTISPMEAYDAFELGYLPEWLTVRKSRYSHLL